MADNGGKKFERTLVAAGFGGQGLMVLGQLIAYTGNAEGRNVSWLPSYGPEMRGGTANCSVVISDEKVGSPVVSDADAVVVMTQPSLTKFKNDVKKGGVLIYNSDLVNLEGENVRSDIRTIAVPANKIANENGSDKVANIVMLGTLVAATDMVSDSMCIEMIKEKLGTKKPQFLPMNLKAYEAGKALVK